MVAYPYALSHWDMLPSEIQAEIIQIATQKHVHQRAMSLVRGRTLTEYTLILCIPDPSWFHISSEMWNRKLIAKRGTQGYLFISTIEEHPSSVKCRTIMIARSCVVSM